LLRDDVFTLVLERILSGELRPGRRLRDADLTAWLNVSRTPVREALGRLVAVGLVTSSPNRFTEIAPLDEGDAVDAVAVLRLLWPAALRSAETARSLESEVEFTLLTRRLERGDLDPALGFSHLMWTLADSLPNRVLAGALRVADLRVIRYLLLVPDARVVLHRERVVALARALCAGAPGAEAGGAEAGRTEAGGAEVGAGTERAAGLVGAILDDLDAVLASRRCAAR
jgi:DNA-binding GntR family transcriptional regulator